MDEDFYCNNVLNNKIKVKKVLETENVLAYYHTKPSYREHIVVVPKKHVENLIELKDDKLIIELMDVIKKVSEEVNKKFGKCRVITNLGEYQDSKHIHFHVVSE